MPNTPGRDAIARSLITALAVKVGMAPLAAARAGGSVAAAAAAMDTAEVTIVAALSDSATVVRVTGGTGPGATFTLERTPLRSV
ncbi:MAG TPA: hypothetical protein VGL44_06065 [Gaiellales bacterium]